MWSIERLLSFDKRLWSDVNIAGLPATSKQSLLTLIAAIIVFQVFFDWMTHQALFAPLSSLKSVVDAIFNCLLLVSLLSLLCLAFFSRPECETPTD